MKKLLCLFLAVAFAFSLVGCKKHSIKSIRLPRGESMIENNLEFWIDNYQFRNSSGVTDLR